MKSIQNSFRYQRAGVMAKICILLSTLAVLPVTLGQIQQCVSLATSTTCAAFNGSSISVDDFMVGLYPFLQGVSDAASFDKNLTAYVQKDYIDLKYQTLFGCSGISLDNTTNLYARFTTTVVCNGVIQNSISRCGLMASNSQPVCADTCAQYALSEQRIVANSDLCSNPSNYTDTQLRADYTNCGLPQNSLTSLGCIEGITNEPTNCGFGYATIGLCQYCSASGENPTDPCCSRAQASARCANIVLPSISVSSTAFLTATGVSSQVSNSPTATSHSNPTGATEQASKNRGGLSGGAIAGIVVGSVAALIFLLALVFLLVCCYRRRHNRSPSKDVSQRKERATVTPEMAYNPHDSITSSLGRAPSEYEVLPGGRSARKNALPSEYSVPPFSTVMPSSTSEYGGDFTTASQKRRSCSSKNILGDLPREFFAHPRSNVLAADSDYVVLPGGRRARMSASIASDSRPVSYALEDNDTIPSVNQATALALEHDRKNFVHKTDVTPELSLNGSTTDKMDSYETLPGGRVARKSGLTGHVGGFTVLENFRTGGKGSKGASIMVSTSTASPPPVTTNKDTNNHEPSPISTTIGPTSSPNLSTKDYYSSTYIHPGDKVTAVWSYAAQTRDEFALERGDVLQVTSIWGDGWAIGYLVKKDNEVSTEQTKIDTRPGQERLTADKGMGDTEVKAFPLICVCASEFFERVIEADGKPLPSTNSNIV